MAMVKEYRQAVSVANLGGYCDVQSVYPQLGLETSPQVYEALEHNLVVAEAVQRLRLPIISKDGEIHEEEIEKWSTISRTSLDSTITGITISSSSNSTNYTNSVGEPEVGGVPNQVLGITPTFLWKSQVQQAPLPNIMTEYQMPLFRGIESRLKAKCDKLADAFVDDIDSLTSNQNTIARLPERVKLMIEEIESEEAILQKIFILQTEKLQNITVYVN